jgi:quinol monooxygenase YgiN
MYRRVVLWRLQAVDAQQRETDAAKIKAALESMRGKIPGMLAIQVGVNVSTTADASEVCMIVDYEDEAALAVYDKHPAHEAVKPIVGPLRSERRVAEFYVD